MIKRIKLYILFCLLIFMGVNGFAQQDPMNTCYLNDPILINPAYAGTRGNVSMTGVFRKQWVGMMWQPTTTTITINSPFWNYKVGVGFSFMNDQMGPLQQTGIYLDYAYHLRFDNKHNLSLGLKAGFTNINFDPRDLTTTSWDYYVQGNDYKPRLLPNFGVGAYYFSDRFYAGFSIPLLLKNSFDKKENTLDLVGREDRTYFLTCGTVFTAIDPVLKIKPTILARAIFGAPPSVEISATAIVYDRIWCGILYRFGDSFSGNLRVQVNPRLQIGYSYDLTNVDLRPYNKGTHEIMINYVFAKRGQRIISPRYF